jgi:hypothetical protein
MVQLHYQEKLERVADVIAKMNLDIWAFEETSPKQRKPSSIICETLITSTSRGDFSEPDAPSDKQTTTVMWNQKTVHRAGRSSGRPRDRRVVPGA